MITFEDKKTVEFDEIEARNAVDVRNRPEWNHSKSALSEAFTYLEERLNDNPSVEEPYKLAAVYNTFEQVRPSIRHLHLKGT